MTHKLSSCGKYLFIPVGQSRLILGDEVVTIDGELCIKRKSDDGKKPSSSEN